MTPTRTRTAMAALIAAVAVSTLAPTAASAQSRGEIRRDRQEVREEQRDLARAYRSGDRDRIRDERDDVRDARREYREDLRDRHHYADWRRFQPGRSWRAQHGQRWHLAPPAYGQRYVQRRHDLLLVNVRTGRTVRVFHGYFR